MTRERYGGRKITMVQITSLEDAVKYFQADFRSKEDICTGNVRWIGLENEYPLVSSDGTMVKQSVVARLWRELQHHGWELICDGASSTIVAARKQRPELQAKKGYTYDLITSDIGYATLEIDLAPARTLHEADVHLRQIIELITSILAEEDAHVLGYGIQPVTPPDLSFIALGERYQMMLDIARGEQVLDTIVLQTVSAACHTHVEVSAEEAVDVLNALNATSGLRIALLANSPIWQQSIASYKAVRQWCASACWPTRLSQLGIPPRFQSIEHYIDYLLDFRAFMVLRDRKPYKLDYNTAFRHFFFAENGQTASTLEGEQHMLYPEMHDLLTQCGFAWGCSRLQPAYGTIEDRVSCQQPPQAHFCASALTLGLVENYRELVSFTERFSLDQWREIRELAYTHGLAWSYANFKATELAEHLVSIAAMGLDKRGLDEKHYLQPLRTRLSEQCCPADTASLQFCQNGIAGLIAHHTMKLLGKPSCVAQKYNTPAPGATGTQPV